MFATVKGTPIDAQNIINRFFKPLLKRSGLPSIRWHDLRHTYATVLLARGTHPTYVQKYLGHATVQLTLDRYSHWMPSMGRNTADDLVPRFVRVYTAGHEGPRTGNARIDNAPDPTALPSANDTHFQLAINDTRTAA